MFLVKSDTFIGGLITFQEFLTERSKVTSKNSLTNPLHQVTEYLPTFPEVMITVGVWAIGFLILTILFKMAIAVREQDLA